MPEVLHVLLGAHGDICTMLPWMKREAERTGAPVKVLVGKAYVPLFDGVSYALPVPWPGDFVQLAAALRFLKQDLPGLQVKVLQYAGRMQDRTFPSFVHEMWYAAGALREFGKWPLVFDRRDAAGEELLAERVRRNGSNGTYDDRRMILVARRGRSSPFKFADEMMRTVRREFGKEFFIVDLAKVRAERIYDLLGLYDRASALVSIDTVHAHLSRASNVPTLVLARDYPQLWDGVPYERRFAFYCRYGAWPRRKGEFVEALRAAVNGQNGQNGMDEVRGLPRLGYNPGVTRKGSDLVLSARVHLQNGDWRTRLVIMNGTVKPVRLARKFSRLSQEDMRLFWHDGKLMGSYTLARMVRRNRCRCVVGYGELIEDEDCWRVKRHLQPAHGRNAWNGMEKNWVFFAGKDEAGRLFAIYGNVRGWQEVLQLDDAGRVVKVFRTRAPRWPHGEIRGGVLVPVTGEGELVRFFHSRSREPRGGVPWRYHMGALRMSAAPPFRILEVRQQPLLSGTEEWMPGCAHWKPNVVFPCGAIDSGDAWNVSIGVNDAASRWLRVEKGIFGQG